MFEMSASDEQVKQNKNSKPNGTETKPSNAKPAFTELTVQDWSEKYWAAGKIGFHNTEVHDLLQKHVDKLLCGRSNFKILVPLCGKSVDMKWLSDAGHCVIGVEGVEQAVLDFFKEQSLDYTKQTLTDIQGDVYKSTDGMIRIYRCDMFDFNRSLESDVDAVWDRGSLVVINPRERQRFAESIKPLASKRCRQLIVTFDYDENSMSPPPHVITQDILNNMFGDEYSVEVLDRRSVLSDRWRRQGLSQMDEVVFLLKHK